MFSARIVSIGDENMNGVSYLGSIPTNSVIGIALLVVLYAISILATCIVVYQAKKSTRGETLRAPGTLPGFHGEDMKNSHRTHKSSDFRQTYNFFPIFSILRKFLDVGLYVTKTSYLNWRHENMNKKNGFDRETELIKSGIFTYIPICEKGIYLAMRMNPDHGGRYSA